jgi:CheY-like chemotaxis protein
LATILIVDDKLVNRHLLTTLLSYKGHRLLAAGDGAEALQMARAEPPDLVVTDLLMPTMDGYELVRQLRADKVLAATPVVLYTAKYHKSESLELMETSGVQFLDKPSEPEVILRAVEQALATGSNPVSQLPEEFDRMHLRLVTDKLSQTVDEMEQVHLRLKALGDLGRQLAEERDPRTVLEQYCYGARCVIAAKYAIVVVLVDDRKSMLHLVTSGLNEATAARLNAPLADLRALRKLLDEGRPFRVRNGHAAWEIIGFQTCEPGFRSLLFVPSTKQTALILADRLGADEFTADDERLAITLTSQMSLCYENAKLRDMVQRMGAANA